MWWYPIAVIVLIVLYVMAKAGKRLEDEDDKEALKKLDAELLEYGIWCICPKCGRHPGKAIDYNTAIFVNRWIACTPYLYQECEVCGYSWKTHTADYERETE